MEKVNLLLYVAHVLDLRIKLKALQYYLVKCSALNGRNKSRQM
jgi:hypothetical protein